MQTISDKGDADSLHVEPRSDPAEQAERCRRLARSAFDRSTAEMLDRMADDFELQARNAARAAD